MNKFKSSKIFILSLGVAAVIGTALSCKVDAASQSPYNRSVRDMMARRHNATLGVREIPNTAPQAQKSAHLGSYGSRVNSSSYTPTYKASSPVSLSLASLFDATDKDGSLFPGGGCKNCYNSGPLIDTGPCERCYDSGPLIDTGPCEKCKKPEPEPIAAPAPEPACPVCVAPKLTNYAIAYNDYVAQAFERNCCAFAPLYLEHVDFNLSNDETAVKNKMGNYRFRIFGCRRFDKEAVLNRGRVMEKDMRLIDIFEEVTGDCYNIIKKPSDICLEKTPSPLPEYVLTAEITDFFMNVCDGYDWDSAKQNNLRTGRSEMTVLWKLSNLSKTKILWQGSTTGYADLTLGVEQGEIALIEAAFADAATNLQAMRGFEAQLMTRLSPEELSAERQALIDEERALDPAKCKFAEPMRAQIQCELTRPEADIRQCPAVQQIIVHEPAPCEPEPLPCAEGASCPVEFAPCPVAQIEENSGFIEDHQILDNCIDENGGVIAGGDCQIVDDTWVETELKAFDSLCITASAPYDVLSPENLYKVRASVVEISNANGKKGAGLIVSDSFALTSADLADANNTACYIRTINGKDLSGRVVRVNPSKNTALVMLDEKTQYTPLALNLDLPQSGKTGFMTLGLLDVEAFDNGSENYIDNGGTVLGYRYSDDKGAEIIVDTNAQDIAIGSVLIDNHGAVNGVAHTGQKTDAGKDLFLPTETALRSLGLTVCDYVYKEPSPWRQTVYKPVTQVIETVQKAPEEMKVQDRK